MEIRVFFVLIFALTVGTESGNDERYKRTIPRPYSTTPALSHKKILFRIIFDFMLHHRFEIEFGKPKTPRPKPITNVSTTFTVPETTSVPTTTEIESTSVPPITTEITETGTQFPESTTYSHTTVTATETTTKSSIVTETSVPPTLTENPTGSTNVTGTPTQPSNVSETTSSAYVTETTTPAFITETTTPAFITETTALLPNITETNTGFYNISDIPHSEPQKSQGKLSTGDIAGIVIGVIAALCLLAVVAVVLVKKKAASHGNDVEPLVP